jgi:hypothetical protein
MIAFARRLLLIFLLLAATGGEAALLQCVAWGSMLAGNLRTASVSQAVSKTFDGQHPCPLCQAIERAKKSEKKSDPIVQATRLEFLPIRRCDWVGGAGEIGRTLVAGEYAETRVCRPLTPPPRA